MNWVLFAVLSSLFFSLSNALTKIFQPKFGLGAGLVLFSCGVLIAALCTALVTKASFVFSKTSQSSIPLALGAGLVWGIAQLLFLIMLSKNAPLSAAIPVVVGGITVGGLVAGILFFGEHLSIAKSIATFLILLGTVIVARS